MKKHTRLNAATKLCAGCGGWIRTTDFDRVRISHRPGLALLCDTCLEEEEDEHTLLLRIELLTSAWPRAWRLA